MGKKIDNLIVTMVNKMLEKHGVDYNFVTENQKDEEIPWYQYFTWSKEEEDIFSEWAIDYMRKKMRWSKKRSENELRWFLFMWGLKYE